MSKLSKQVNEFFSTAIKSDITKLLEEALINEHLGTILKMRYFEGLSIDEIAFKTGFSRSKIDKDLNKIRKKISKLMNK